MRAVVSLLVLVFALLALKPELAEGTGRYFYYSNQTNIYQCGVSSDLQSWKICILFDLW